MGERFSILNWMRGHWTRSAVVISLLLHVAFALFAGVYVAIRILHKPQSTLIAEAPPRPALELRKLEMQVKVADLQKNSARPRLTPRMVSLSPSDIALPEINVTPKVVQRKVKRDYATVGVSGFGSGIGGGLGTGMGGGSGDVTFFGLKGAGEKVCLIVDVSLSMCEDERGGLNGFQNVKREVGKVLSQLKDGMLFNVIAFENDVARCWKRMRSANKATRQEATDWVLAYNTLAGPYGLPNANYSPGKYGMDAAGGSSRLDLALTAAFEQGADAIFVITDGLPRIEKDPLEVKVSGRKISDSDIRDWEKRMEDYEKDLAKWEKEQAKRAKKGKGPSLREGGSDRPRVPRKPKDQEAGTRKKRQYWSQEDILAHIRMLQRTLYTDRGRMEATVHAVGYEVEKETRSFLRDLAKDNNGKYRSIGSM